MNKKSLSLLLVLFMSLILVWPTGSLLASSSSSGSSAKIVAVAAKKVTKKKVVIPLLTAKDLLGRLVLEKDSYNKLWYIEPTSKERYYLNDTADIKELIALVGVKTALKDYQKIAKNDKTKTATALKTKYGGKILVASTTPESACYLNPADGICYVISDYADLYAVAKVIGLSASDVLLRQLVMNTKQLTYDPAFNSIAYVGFDGEKYFDGSESDRILPLASLSKVMTALVFVETNPDWNKIIEITPEEIQYPCTLQTCGTTSEINLKSGDKLRVIDLWVAMLSASSNQSAVILADNSGMTRQEFIARMNSKAKELGLTKTHFEEMSGLSAGNISTAKEYAKVASVAFDNSWIAEGTRSVYYNFTVEQADGTAREVSVLNRNNSLLAMGPDASKSGYLVEAQRNAVVRKDGKIFIALHCYSLTQRNQVISRLINGSALATAQ